MSRIYMELENLSVKRTFSFFNKYANEISRKFSNYGVHVTNQYMRKGPTYLTMK